MANPKETGLSDNSIASLAYFSPIPALFFLAIRRYNKRPYVRFHAWQSLVFSAFVFLFATAQSYLLPLTMSLRPHLFSAIIWIIVLIWIALAIAWLWCVIGALYGKRCKLPIIGKWADEQAYR